MDLAQKADHFEDLTASQKPLLDRLYTTDEAYEYCAAMARSHYENFPVASLAIPKKFRKHIAAVYAFARTADDFADEKEYADSRMARLKSWELKLEGMEKDQPTHPVFVAFRDTVRTFDLPKTLFTDLLTAFKMDVVVNRHATFNDVLKYCRYSANPVGRIVLHIMGFSTPKNLELSDAICTALQLANFWQDVGVDLDKNRIYIPQEDMDRFEVTEEELFRHEVTDRFRQLMDFQVSRTMEVFNRGKNLCALVPGRLGLELRLTWLGGMTILKKIRKVNGDVFNRRPVLGKGDLTFLFLAALRKGAFKGGNTP